MEKIDALLPNKKPQKVVDLGCGKLRWKKEGYDVTWVDKQPFPDAVKADLNKDFPFKDEEFDGLVAIELIEHLENPHHFLREATRITKDWLIITTPQAPKWFNETRYFSDGHITHVPLWFFKCYSELLGWQVMETAFNNSATKEILIVKIERLLSFEEMMKKEFDQHD
jgi:ubiquinone/menaquinone biosynthesis C-methylase UbiE